MEGEVKEATCRSERPLSREGVGVGTLITFSADTSVLPPGDSQDTWLQVQ